jgi:hypothetical protein
MYLAKWIIGAETSNASTSKPWSARLIASEPVPQPASSAVCRGSAVTHSITLSTARWCPSRMTFQMGGMSPLP